MKTKFKIIKKFCKKNGIPVINFKMSKGIDRKDLLGLPKRTEVCYQVNTAFGQPGHLDRVSAYRLGTYGKDVVFSRGLSPLLKEIRKMYPNAHIKFEFQPEG